MKKILFFLCFMFVVCVMNLEAGIVSSSAKSFQFDKSAMIQQKIKKAQACINSGQFATAETLLRGVLKLAPGNRHAKALLVSCEEGVKKQKMKELQAFNDACSQATPFALQSFISKYPKSEKVNDAKNRLQDYKLWHVASSKNTLDAYNDYLSKSVLKAYQNEAYIAINKLSEEKEWNNCKDGTNEEKISAFITLYPNSVHVGQAKYFLNIIRGEKNYASGYNYTAYEYYKNADAYKTLTGVPAIHYQELKEARELSEILQSESETKVSAFLQTLPYNSVHRDEVSNRLAILKATNLTLFSSKYSMDDAMSFAKDSQTRAIVKQYIDSVKNMRKSYEKRQRALSRQEWWEDRVSVGWNIVHVDYLNDCMGIGSGMKLKLGKWSDAINFIVGIEYSYHLYINPDYDDYSYDEDETYPIAHQISIPVGLRFNTFSLGSKYKLFIGCNAVFGFNIACGDDILKEVVNKNNIAVEPQIGVGSRYFDFGIYYMQYLDRNPLLKYVESKYNQRIGAFCTWYF